MANSIIEGPIPLAGPGFIAKENGNFQPGEYKRLNNLELDESGVLVNRRNIYNVNGENTGSAVNSITNPQRFMGNIGRFALISTGPNQHLAGDSTFLPLWSCAASGGPTPAPSFSKFVGFFRYNNKNFWLVMEFASGVAVRLVLYHDASIPVPDIPETYAAGYEASLTRTVILSFGTGTTDFYEFQYKNFFIYKERLWIATTVGLYFSAATDPLDFAVPNGGFFKHPGNRINYSFAIKDQIYTLCDDAVYALTYNTDPNLDSTERPLSDTIGGEMGCIHLDTAYFINNQGIYVINGTNVDKVMDSRFDYGKDAYKNHIFSFEDYLVINKYSPVNYDNNNSPPATVTSRRNLITAPESDAVGGSQIIAGWTTANSGTQVRSNLQLNSAVDFTPNDVTIIDYTSQDPGNYVLGHEPNIWTSSPAAGRIQRLDGIGTIDTIVRGADKVAIPGLSYVATLNARTPGAGFRDITLVLNFKNGAGVNLGATMLNYNLAASTWHRIGGVAEAPAGTTHFWWDLRFKNVVNTNDHYWDDVLVEQAEEVRSYFDGGFVDTTFKDFAFSGTAHKSTSTCTIKSCIMNAITAFSDGISSGKVLRWGGTFVDPADLEGLSDYCWGSTTKTFTPTTPPVPGISYQFRFNHKGTNTSGGVLGIKFEYLSAADVVLGSSSSTISSSYSSSASYNTYSKANLSFPVNAVKLRVTLTYSKSVEGSVGTTAWNIDCNKFHLEKASTFSGYFSGATTDTADVVYSWAGTAFASESITGSATTHSYLKNNGKKFEPFLLGNSLGYNTYFINTNNGATHVVDFMDQYVDNTHGGAGFIVDCLVNPYSDTSGNDRIFFLTNKSITETESGLTYKGNVYFMATSEDTDTNDFAVNNSGILIRRPPKIDVEWDSLVPDGLEYRFKKFRSLMIQGVFPSAGMRMDIGYDNTSGTEKITTFGDTESEMNSPRRHYAHRLGLNQRGHSLTLRLRNVDWATEISEPFGDLEISDMRVMWSYTARLPTSKRNSS